MNTTLGRNPIFFTSALAALVVSCSARQAEAAASTSGDTSGRWTATAAGAYGYGCAETLLPDGNVLLVESWASSEVYEVASDKWTTTSPLKERRWGPTATLLPNGKV